MSESLKSPARIGESLKYHNKNNVLITKRRQGGHGRGNGKEDIFKMTTVRCGTEFID